MMRSEVLLLFLALTAFVLCGCTAPLQAKGPDSGAPAMALRASGGVTTGTGSTANIDRMQQDIEKATASLQGMVLEHQENSLLLTIPADELFEPEATALKPASDAQIGIIAEVLKTSVHARVTVHCHTDSTGSEQVNLTLSEERAQIVKEALVRKGLDSSRITALGHGESEQVTSNATENGRQINRRISLEINVL